MQAGKLRDRVTFQSRRDEPDGFGNVVSTWAGDFSRWCNVRYLRGSETVIAARLEGRQPVIITVRKDPQTDLVEPGMRCMVNGRTYNIREYPRPSDDRMMYEFLAESGVADG
jgi:SPP1 family predicted phage head-tail adaptor